MRPTGNYTPLQSVHFCTAEAEELKPAFPNSSFSNVLLALQMQIRFNQLDALAEIWKAEVKWRSSSCCLHCFLLISEIVKIPVLYNRFQHPTSRGLRGYYGGSRVFFQVPWHDSSDFWIPHFSDLVPNRSFLQCSVLDTHPRASISAFPIIF